MLAAFNVTATAQEIDTIFDLLADGTIEPATHSGDLITSLRLTEAGRECLPMVLPEATA
jgi:hypothetical protein